MNDASSHRFGACFAAMLWLFACGSDSSEAGRAGAQAAGAGGSASIDNPASGGSTTENPGGDANCQASTQRCYCTDGELRGTQTCANGSLGPCLCEQHTAGAGEQTPLCEELKNQSGCMADSYESAKLPASILFLVDRSQSMACNPPPLQTSESCEAQAVPVDPAQPSRWQVTVNALKDAFKELKSRNANASVGLTFFSNDNTCGVNSKPVVSIGPLTDSNVGTLGTILDATRPSGGTPVIGAMVLAYQHLHEEAGAMIECPGPDCPCAAPPCGAFGNRYVVLITDSSSLDSCAADAAELNAHITQLLDVEAPKAVRANVRSFVVGAPGSEPSRGLLSELAFQGGTARNGGQCDHDRASSQGDCHFDMTTTQDFAADLATVLQDISGAALSCQFSVPTALDSTGSENVNVQLTSSGAGVPECLLRDDTLPCDAGADGWQFAKLPDGNDDLTKVVLCGPACDRVEADPGARVDVLVGCRKLTVQ